MVKNMNKIVERLQKEFFNSSDLIIKTVNNIYIIYLESVSSSDRINDYVLKELSLTNKKNGHNLESLIAGPNTTKIQKYDQLEFYLGNGFVLIIYENDAYAVEVKADINRSITTPETQPAIYGPKDAFNENIQNNLGLIKRRIKSNTLINEDFIIGRKTKTKVSILYLNDIAEEATVKKVKQQLKSIDIDGIIDSGNIHQLLEKNNKSPFPTIRSTERPDYASANLLEGRIVILVDTSPFALVLPVFFVDYINPQVDQYSKSLNINFLKVIRLACLILTILVPALYIAIINYNPEVIPLNLLVNFATQRDGVPFPAAVEAIIMLLICEVLRESDIRFPSSYGSSISILGALILGESAVTAGIVSPIMIIVVALTFITSLIFTELEFINSIRHFRFLFLLAAAFFGLFGLVIAGVIFLTHLCNTSSYDKPFSYPLAPFDLNYFRKELFQKPKIKDRLRSKMLTNKNYVSQGENKI